MTVSVRSIERVVPSQATSDGAGVKLRRSIGTPALEQLDPFLLLDCFESESADDYIAGFPDHPHRGFETVTYMIDGAMRHRDNAGNEGLLGPGSVQWMTAGRGIIHSEMPEQEEGLMKGFQLWVNLPAKLKMCAPRYQDIPAADVPVIEPAPGVRVKVIAGEVFGVIGPVRDIIVAPLYLDLALEAGAAVEVPLAASHTGFVYLFEGEEVTLGAGDRVGRQSLGVLGAGELVRAEATAGPARLLLIAAAPIGEPVARHGPFVMNSREEIIQAVEDFQAGRF